MAWTVKELSCDAETKHGCIITNKDNRIIGTGYNSFPRECDNESLPNIRPDKYPFMIHSEENAVTNCTHKPKDCGGGIAYVTGICCYLCTRHLWNNGVDEIYQIQRGSHMLKDSDDERLKAILCEQVPLKLHIVDGDFGFMKEAWHDAKCLGFVNTELQSLVGKFKEAGVC